MRIFGNTAEKRAKDAEAREEGERLQALPIADLAVEVMAAFGPDGMGTKSGHQAGSFEVDRWLAPDAPPRYRAGLGAVTEALDMLEHANLLTRRSFGSKGQGSTYSATSTGMTALAEGTVREKLG